MADKGHLKRSIDNLQRTIDSLKYRTNALKSKPKYTNSTTLSTIGACLDWAGIQVENARKEVDKL